MTIAVEFHKKPVIAKHSLILSNIILNGFDLRRKWSSDSESYDSGKMAAIEDTVNDLAIKMIFKYSDKIFRPIFSKMVDWATTSLHKKDNQGRNMRLQSFFAFATVLFGKLGSSITSYATYILESAVDVLKTVDSKDSDSKELWSRVLQALRECFEHDTDDFWQTPAHFGAVAPILVSQFTQASNLPLEEFLIPAIVELAAVAESSDHRKELNSSILKHLRSENAEVRLAAVKCQRALTIRLGLESWLDMLPEMLPYISELQDDDDQAVSRETTLWTIGIEDITGESMEDMLK